ncbi:toprim domain-containing protein, partial [Patescibacteria group bacterium]|nr:toprim domain-containing protein [Patescibacteria group bacterium]
MNAKAIVVALKGHWYGSSGICRCPAHDDAHASLSVSERQGKVLVKCHAGCSQIAVIDALKRCRLWEGHPDRKEEIGRKAGGDREEAREESRKLAIVKRIWGETVEIAGTLAEIYMRNRGVYTNLPPCLRYHRCLAHPDGGEFPAMVACLEDDSGILAIQRTYLTEDGHKRPGANKLSLGRMHGAAVQLSPARATLGLAEGIETAMSASILYSMPVWASLSCTRLPETKIPNIVETLVIFADAGRPGLDNAIKAVQRHARRDLTVIIEQAQEDDFNTELT